MILYIADNLSAPSHVWMVRMLEGLKDQVAILADGKAPENNEYKFDFLSTQIQPKNYFQRGLRKLGLFDSREKVNKRLSKALRSDSISTVLVHFLTVAIRYREALCSTEKPIYVHCHGYDVTWDKRHDNNPAKLLHAPDYVEQVRRLPKNFYFIANSTSTFEALTEIGIDKKRIFIKPLGTSLPKNPSNKKYGYEFTELLYLGRLIDFKGPDLTIKAFELACDKGFKGHLTIAGDGALRTTCELLRARSRYRDSISIIGAVGVGEADRLREKAHIFTAHSCVGPVTRQLEAYGVAFLEALAYQLPVVTGNVGGFCDFVKHGHNGLLFEPGDIEAHADALLSLQQKPALCKKMGEIGRQTVEEKYTIQHEIKQLKSILNIS